MSSYECIDGPARGAAVGDDDLASAVLAGVRALWWVYRPAAFNGYWPINSAVALTVSAASAPPDGIRLFGQRQTDAYGPELIEQVSEVFARDFLAARYEPEPGRNRDLHYRGSWTIEIAYVDQRPTLTVGMQVLAADGTATAAGSTRGIWRDRVREAHRLLDDGRRITTSLPSYTGQAAVGSVLGEAEALLADIERWAVAGSTLDPGHEPGRYDDDAATRLCQAVDGGLYDLAGMVDKIAELLLPEAGARPSSLDLDDDEDHSPVASIERAVKMLNLRGD